MKYDAIIIGGGLSGLTAGSLLAKRRPAVIDKGIIPEVPVVYSNVAIQLLTKAQQCCTDSVKKVLTPIGLCLIASKNPLTSFGMIFCTA